jgi:hypothetical protein
LRIELLHFEGCPGSMEVLGIFERLIAQEGLVAEISSITSGPEDRSNFPGSPIILVNGEDLFPAEPHSTRATSCRLYATPEGLKNRPTATMVREALVKRSSDKSSADHRQISPRL